ncbi:MAG: cadherin-like beta sandwich domain-containing protein [Bacteroidales bacterium]|nr:cadherin-like beta sandwich domain-containing protein [Bacteroidales bacterium]
MKKSSFTRLLLVITTILLICTNAYAANYNVSSSSAVITSPGAHTITGTTTSNTIAINNSSANAVYNITLNGVNINATTWNSSFTITNSASSAMTVNLIVVGSNTLIGYNHGGIKTEAGTVNIVFTTTGTGTLTVGSQYSSTAPLQQGGGTLNPSIGANTTATATFGGTSMTVSAAFTAAMQASNYGKNLVLTLNSQNLSSDATLSNLTVNSGTLTPSFSSSTYTYNVTVGYNVSSITIGATANNANATVAGAGTKTISVGNNSFNVIVTAQDNSYTQTYTVNVYRKSNDATLSTLTVSEGALTPSFTPATFTYNVTVGYDISSLTIGATANNSNATVAGAGTKTISVGNNSFNVIVTAEDNSYTQTYTVNVHRKSNDATLSNIALSSGMLLPNFTSNNFIYSVEVVYDIEELTIAATTNHANATVSGEGIKVLAIGNNLFSLIVTAEDNNYTHTYTIFVRRLLNDATLSGITINEGTLTPVFNPNTYEYNVTVDSNITSITIGATANDSGASVDGNGTYNLEYGENIIYIVVTAEDGTELVYVIIVYRKSNDATLSTLTVSQGELTPTFDPNTYEYDVTVVYDVEELDILATASHINATVTGIGSKTLSVGDNSFNIIVEAEHDIHTTTYTVNVRRQSNDATLSDITVNPGTLSPTFSPTILNYTVEVPYETIFIDIIGTTNHTNAMVTNASHYQLSLGENVVTLMVTSEDGISTAIYTITVTRLLNSDASLKSIYINNGVLDPAFNTQTFSYTVNVPNTVSNITVTGSSNCPYATVAGNITNSSINVGSNIFTITVTAQDEATELTYTVTVIKAASTNANLQSLIVSEGSLVPGFNANITNYSINLPNETTSISITGTANYSGASVNGNVTNAPLSVGQNTFTIQVTAEDGTTTKNYTINVYRNQNSDATLSGITVSQGTLTPTFNSSTTNYLLNVPNEISTITITGTANNSNATVAGNVTNAPISVGKNIFVITVTAENGINTKNYTIEVDRTASADATLSSIVLSEGTLAPAFSPNVTTYTVNLPNSTTNISITGASNHPEAIVQGNINNLQLIEGLNTVTLLIIAENQSTTQTYVINIYREVSLYYTIYSNVFNGVGGIINPEGIQTYIMGSDITYTITPDDGYYISELLINNINVDVTDNYTFTNVVENHSIVVKFLPELGIEDMNEIEIKVYPNPATNYVIIESKEIINSVVIFNSTGKKIFENRNIVMNSIRIDINNYPTGIYYINIDGETEKMIKN